MCVKNKARTSNLLYTETYFPSQVTADEILVGSSAKVAHGNTLPATKEYEILLLKFN